MTNVALVFDSFMVKFDMCLQMFLSNFFPTMFTCNLGLVHSSHMLLQDILCITLSTDGATDFLLLIVAYLVDHLDVPCDISLRFLVSFPGVFLQTGPGIKTKINIV